MLAETLSNLANGSLLDKSPLLIEFLKHPFSDYCFFGCCHKWFVI
ncbi:hypothetical protein EI77_03069 [Prosthecobacter fusiformis]|uniref:Uncharacterized protein n=1 Tax=Prosthecobacter fusiformis TaxID=48464 RepID=A0A4R7RWQ3_9BACT|nr:hypothetical protein EI77_03069 [Prosthecobacter fusiformis]